MRQSKLYQCTEIEHIRFILALKIEFYIENNLHYKDYKDSIKEFLFGI